MRNVNVVTYYMSPKIPAKVFRRFFIVSSESSTSLVFPPVVLLGAFNKADAPAEVGGADGCRVTDPEGS